MFAVVQWRMFAVGIFLCLLLRNSAVAFSSTSKSTNEKAQPISRLSFLEHASSITILVTAITTKIEKAHAVVLDNSSIKVGTLKDLTLSEAEQRFRDGRKTVDYLLQNYDSICDGGGDNVRRYLGTVGTSSGLFGIQKAMKALSERADDIVECEWKIVLSLLLILVAVYYAKP